MRGGARMCGGRVTTRSGNVAGTARGQTASTARRGGVVIFRQYVLGCLSQLSYLIGDESSGRAVVVDPHRDVAVYRDDAAAHGLQIERVIQTHCHADFLSGHLELAAAGATICYGD